MLKEYQVTLFCKSKKLKPVSAIVKYEQAEDTDLSKDKTARREILVAGMQNICMKRYWTSHDLKVNEYSVAKVRAYNKAEIQSAKDARYQEIKEKKYATGEWKRCKAQG